MTSVNRMAVGNIMRVVFKVLAHRERVGWIFKIVYIYLHIKCIEGGGHHRSLTVCRVWDGEAMGVIKLCISLTLPVDASASHDHRYMPI